ncbi:MAG TPA: HD domain-containing phosphohydrolase [Thermoguttaceae bacterium]|nr:HD domain-containing phosphohydrolase [Thermoguttaceae bacterium]
MTPSQLTSTPSISSDVSVAVLAPEILSPQVLDLLDRAFGVEFTVVDGRTGQVLHEAADQPARDWDGRGELCRQVAERGAGEFIEENDPFVVLALPIIDPSDESPRVAVATFVTRPIAPDEDLHAAARLAGLSPETARRWARAQAVWPSEALRRVADLVVERLTAGRRAEALDREVRSLSGHLSATYEEISLIYRLTQNLKLSAGDEELGKIAIEGLQEVVPADGIALLMLPVVGKDEALQQQARSELMLLVRGDCPLDAESLQGLIEHLGLHAHSRPLVANTSITENVSWPVPAVRQCVIVPLSEGDNLFGWLAIANHRAGGEFGTVEANLLHSVATILGIHSGNIDLYRQHSEMFAGVVRAMVSAIDAKDPYTRGHSDRVARISVCLAQEMGCDQDALHWIYLSGLLHDVGKIGIDDHVLRKPGKLTAEEYEHIKSHVTVGHRILRDLKKMENVLPVVLHHHEAWAGGGYPNDLRAERIPRGARIVAVADAFDAMSSDRPYRKGMPDEKIDAIFHEGAGQQWDPAVVETFFRVRRQIGEISRRQREEVDGELCIWAQ